MKLLGKLDKKCYVGCSGGRDSMTLLHFLLKGRREVEVLHFNHGTVFANDAQKFLEDFCKVNNIPLHIGYYKGNKTTENDWRNARYEFFNQFKNRVIYLGHTLSDNIETFLFSTIKGTSKFIPYQRDNIIRPFLLVSNDEINKYCKKNNVTWIEDPSNAECNYDRNKIRNNVIPVLKEINPGLEKTFKQKCLDKYKSDGII